MNFIHEDREFAELMQIVGAEHNPPIDVTLVEKDYWVTHTLWSIQKCGLECWFKGGTSLSKGFGIIHRFSEDIDLKLGAGAAEGVVDVENWTRKSSGATQRRRDFFLGVHRVLSVHGAAVSEPAPDDRHWRQVKCRVEYPFATSRTMPEPMRSYVLIEAGQARVLPGEPRDLTSFVHDALARRKMLEQYLDNRPRRVMCVHPLVTLIEKLEAICKKFDSPNREVRTFVRHYEDAARIIERQESLPVLHGGLAELVREMIDSGDIKNLPPADSECFSWADSERWRDVNEAHREMALMFFGPRIELQDACERVRAWLRSTHELCERSRQV